MRRDVKHEEVLNALLADDCARDRDDATGIATFEIELHCVYARVMAKSLGDGRYEILSYESHRGSETREDHGQLRLLDEEPSECGITCGSAGVPVGFSIIDVTAPTTEVVL